MIELSLVELRSKARVVVDAPAFATVYGGSIATGYLLLLGKAAECGWPTPVVVRNTDGTASIAWEPFGADVRITPDEALAIVAMFLNTLTEIER